jgi:lysophospholipase L1-like esterase
MHVSEPISSLAPGTTYHYRVCTSPGAQPGSRGCTPQDRTFATVSAGAKRYIALGDSLTQIGDSQRYPERFFSYLDGIAAADELHNIGESGQASGGLNGGQLTTARQLIDDPDTDATVVTIDVGGNDLLGQPVCNPQSTSFDLTACQPTLAQFSTNFTSTLDSLNASLDDDPGGGQLIVIAYYNAWSGRIGEEMAAGNVELGLLGTDGTLDCEGTGEELGLNDRIACIGFDHGAKLADMYPPFVGHGPIGDYFADTVHPNGTGHQVMADVLQAAFEP